MSIFTVAGVTLLAVVLTLLLRETRAALALPVRLALSLLLFGAALGLYLPILAKVMELFKWSGAGDRAGLILRAAGIALVAEFSATLCRDLGENGAAEGLQLFGKLEIILLSLPLMDELIEIAKELLAW